MNGCLEPGVAEPSPKQWWERSTALVVAHPDDEVIGAGAQLPHFENLTIVHLTDAPRNLMDARAAGFDSREAYAAARRLELREAVALGGQAKSRLVELNVPDQEAPYRLPDLALRLSQLFREADWNAVWTHPYEGGHPDHDATAFAVHAAVELLRRDGFAPPTIFEMTSYHRADEGLVSGEFLAPSSTPTWTFELSPAEQELKSQLFRCFRTQQRTLAGFRLDVERFREAALRISAWSSLLLLPGRISPPLRRPQSGNIDAGARYPAGPSRRSQPVRFPQGTRSV